MVLIVQVKYNIKNLGCKNLGNIRYIVEIPSNVQNLNIFVVYLYDMNHNLQTVIDITTQKPDYFNGNGQFLPTIQF